MNSGYSTDNKFLTTATLSTDGPTLEEYLAAGYRAADYPPFGYAEKPSEGLTLYRTTGQLPVTQKPVDPLHGPPIHSNEAPPANVLATPEPVAEVVPDPPPAAAEPVTEKSSDRKRK